MVHTIYRFSRSISYIQPKFNDVPQADTEYHGSELKVGLRETTQNKAAGKRDQREGNDK